MFFPSQLPVANPMQSGGFNTIAQGAQQFMGNTMALQQQAAQTAFLPSMLQQRLRQMNIENTFLPGMLGASIFSTGMQGLSVMANHPAWLAVPQINRLAGHALGTFGSYVGGSGNPITATPYNNAVTAATSGGSQGGTVSSQRVNTMITGSNGQKIAGTWIYGQPQTFVANS